MQPVLAIFAQKECISNTCAFRPDVISFLVESFYDRFLFQHNEDNAGVSAGVWLVPWRFRPEDGDEVGS